MHIHILIDIIYVYHNNNNNSNNYILELLEGIMLFSSLNKEK